MSYARKFHPREITPAGTALVGDQSDGAGYVFSDAIVLAVRTALATSRALLVRGESGIGKSSLAAAIAAQLGWRKLERVISSRSEARELLWDIDHLRRLHDARATREDDALSELGKYVQPGILWWAFDRQSAERQYTLAGGKGPRYESDEDRKKKTPAVVLLDEIDKADPDLPNNLLVPLGSLKFLVEPTQKTVTAKSGAVPLLVITSNDERELPAAFLRRCVELVLELPGDDVLLQIGAKRYPKLSEARRKRVLKLMLEAKPENWQGRARPVPAEYLDMLRAVSELLTAKEDVDKLLKEMTPLLIWKASQNVRP